MNKKSILLIAIIFFIPLMSAFSQSNEELDRFLGQDKADLATTVWLVYLSAELLPQDATPQDAIDKLNNSEQGKRFKNLQSTRPIKYKEFAYLVMEAHKLPGGLFYSIFRAPRYAARELPYRRWMPGDPNPGSELTPWDVTTSISEILVWKESQR